MSFPSTVIDIGAMLYFWPRLLVEMLSILAADIAAVYVMMQESES